MLDRLTLLLQSWRDQITIGASCHNPRKGKLATPAQLAFLGVLFSSSAAVAYQAEVDASLNAQFYSLQSPYGDPIVRRRRYTQTLALSVYDIQGERVPLGPTLAFKSRLRLDSDFGYDPAELDANSARFIPGVREAPFDLMYAYLEGQRYFDGHVGFRLGRQYTIDSLGFWSFDGAEVTLTTPVYLAFQIYAGAEQRGGLPMLGTSRFTADGVFRGNRDDLELAQYSAFLEESALAPAFGAAIETAGLHWLHSRLVYRAVQNRDRVVVSPFADAGGGFYFVGGERTSSERLGYSLRVNESTLGAISGSFVYDFYSQVLSEYAAAVEYYATDTSSMGAELEYYLPTFDGDSIFNWFSHHGMTTALGRARAELSREIDVSGAAGVKLFETEGDPDSYSSDSGTKLTATHALVDVIGMISGRYRWADGSLTLNGQAETGERARRVGADITTRKLFDDGFYDTMVVLSLYDWKDELRPDRDATSFSYVLGAGFSPGISFLGTGRLGAEWEHAVNRLVGQRFRMLVTLDFSLLR